jgi:hypothetical protein
MPAPSSSVPAPARVRPLILWLAAAAALYPAPAAAADKVRITNLSDIAFGTVGNLTVDAVRAEDVCIYSSSATNGYHVTATGTGAGGAFELLSGSNPMAFDVAWSSASGQSSGSVLTPAVPLTGQVSAANQQTCNSGPATTASLIIILRAAALSSATAGTYSGTLTLVVGPE